MTDGDGRRPARLSPRRREHCPVLVRIRRDRGHPLPARAVPVLRQGRIRVAVLGKNAADGPASVVESKLSEDSAGTTLLVSPTAQASGEDTRSPR